MTTTTMMVIMMSPMLTCHLLPRLVQSADKIHPTVSGSHPTTSENAVQKAEHLLQDNR